MVQELLRSDFLTEQVYTTDLGLIEKTDVPVTVITEKELERISGLKSPNRMLALAKIPTEIDLEWSEALILLLDGIRDPGNLGTIIRTARWFGITDILCSEDCADVWDRKVVQSTMGALFHVNVRYVDLGGCAKDASRNGYSILGATMSGTPIKDLSRHAKTALVIGSESHGIRPEVLSHCTLRVSIPNQEKSRFVESLNAAVATSVIIYELTRGA